MTEETKKYAVLSLAARLRENANSFLVAELRDAGLDDITTACGDVFVALREAGPMTLSALAKRIRRNKATTSVMTERLVRLGYVTREHRADDKRSQFIALTDAGQAILPEMDRIAGLLNQKLLAGFTDEEAQTLERLLLKAVDNFLPGDEQR